MNGRLDTIEVNSKGEIWFGTATGHVYRSADWNTTWNEITVPFRQYWPGNYSASYDSINHVRFFDAQHAIIAGYMGDSQDVVYRTVDGGAGWSSVRLPASLWVYDARTTTDGLAWLVGSDGSLLFSEDFGASWSALKAPFDQISRSHSVQFVSRSLGVVGSLHGSLKITRDGGHSWRSIKTPTETGDVKCEYDRIERARISADKVIVEQCGGVFYRGFNHKEPWRQLHAGERALVSYEMSPEGLVAVASDREIVRFAPNLQAPRSTGFHLEAFPLDMTVGAGKVVFVDSNLKVSVMDGEGFKSSRMLRGGIATTWPISERDRGLDGAFWGISRYFLYRSSNVGITWERQAELPQEVDGLAVQASGDILLWNRHGFVTRWNPADRQFHPVPGLDGLDVVGLFRRGNLWLVYGGMQSETTQRIEVARTYFSGQFAGSADHGYVAASTDGGGTWRVVDEWKDGGVQALFLGEDNTLTLLSWLGAVRRGRFNLEPTGSPTAALETILPVYKETWGRVPYVEDAHILEFIGGTDGSIKGWTHHLGDFLFHTVDGGKTWVKSDVSKQPLDRIYRLGEGRWVGLAPPDQIQIWKDGKFISLRKFSEKITWTIVDTSGSLVLQLDSGQVWSLSPDSKEWRLLSDQKARQTAR
ncbi:MAG: hypothetical protein DMF51_02165 [Acidobacteria bacterium]|nr:MAG: hypothetical protein DMF51_02165 [Acidobacteriota bacterium]